MSEIKFSPIVGTTMASQVINHPTASPLNKNNIQFHIGGEYLKDFTDDGIKQFIDKNYNDKTGFIFGWGGKDLEFSEVKAFILSAAKNADRLTNATFDLADPKLGLSNEDDIDTDHIKSRFTLETKTGELPSNSVVFFDTTKSTFALKDAEDGVSKAKKLVESSEDKLDKVKSKLENAQWEYDSMVNFLGKDAVKELENNSSGLNKITEEIKALRTQRTSIQEEIKTLEKTPGNDAQINKLRLAVIGVNYEIHEKEKEGDKANESLTKTRGPLGFIGIGERLDELKSDIAHLNSAKAEVQKAEAELKSAKETLKQAQDIRTKIKNGEDFPAPVQTTPTTQPTTPTTQPTTQPTHPTTPTDPYISVPGSNNQPPLYIEPGSTIPTVTEHPTNTTPVTVPTQQPVNNGPGYVSVPGANNHPPLYIEEGTVVNTKPDAPLYTPPSPVGLNPYDSVEHPTTTTPVGNAQPVTPSQPVQAKFYVVKNGDTLTLIAKNELGDMRRWSEIRDLNKDVIGTSNTHWLYPGQQLKLPSK